MRLLLIDNAHIYKFSDGKFYSKGIYDNRFFSQYLNKFDEVRFCAKVKEIKDTKNISEYTLIDIQGLEIFPLPWYQGSKEFLINYLKIRRRFIEANKNVDVQIYRMTQIESIVSYFHRNKSNPYAVEVVNDAKSYYKWPYKIIHYFAKHIILNANGASYITKKYLQNKYPSKVSKKNSSKHYFQTTYQTSDPIDYFVMEPKKYPTKLNRLNLVHVSNNIDNDMKGHKIVIDIINKLKLEGIDCLIFFVGDGNRVEYFKEYARKLNVENQVIFYGRINKKENLLNFLREKDIFIFPSMSEGLGRVFIEAMSVGLPCVGSNSGGIIELLNNDYLFEPKDILSYVNALKTLYLKPNLLELMSLENTKAVKQFIEDNSTDNRVVFYKKLTRLK